MKNKKVPESNVIRLVLAESTVMSASDPTFKRLTDALRDLHEDEIGAIVDLVELIAKGIGRERGA